jgi:glycosyltransferase involved in cell wall biosynthesis
LKLAAVVTDLTPFLRPERDLNDHAEAERGYRALLRLRHYDAILTPSAVTGRDACTLLGLPAERVHTIGNAADRRAFRPVPSLPMPLAARRVLHELGVRRAYLLVDAGSPGQQNVERMIAAYQELPERLRRAYQLVFVGPVPGGVIERVQAAIEPPPAPGNGDAVLFTSSVSPAALRTLLQYCTVYVHPALYTGSGQPILEAMLCGAAVVAGSNSAQAEVVGDAGLLVDPSDPRALGQRIRAVLDDWTLARTLRSRAVAHAGQSLFGFAHAAACVLTAFESTFPRLDSSGTRPLVQLRADPPHPRQRRSRSRPRIAFFSPLPPRISGIASYAFNLLQELKAAYTIDLYHDAGYPPDLGPVAREFAAHDARLFERYNLVLNYQAVVYQMGNSLADHGYLYQMLLRHPGVVTLHDFFLSVYPYRGTRGRADILASFRRAITHFCPDRAAEFLPHLEDWCEEEGGLTAACARRGLYLNRAVFESALAVVVHSPWCVEQVRAWMPEQLEKTVVIPHGVWPRTISAAERAAIRGRFEIRHDALVVASFGFVHPNKMSPEALDAFQPLARSHPSALFLFAGEEADCGATRQRAAALGISDRVRFLGRQPAADYADLIAASDLGVNLRRPPTNGETSGALLDLLAAGIPTIVTDVDTFADYPEGVVRKVRWDRQGADTLRRVLAELAGDPGARATLGNAARSHVSTRHAWGHAAACYAELIERCAAASRHGSQPAVPAKETP